MQIFLTEIHGSAEHVALVLAHGARQAENPIEPLTKISADMFKIEEAVFSSQGRRGGGAWKKLKDDTIKRKGSTNILEDTGALRASLTRPGAPHQVLEVNRLGIVFGTTREFAAVHQHGSTYNNRPARPFIKLMPSDFSRWNRWLLEHLMIPFVADK